MSHNFLEAGWQDIKGAGSELATSFREAGKKRKRRAKITGRDALELVNVRDRREAAQDLGKGLRGHIEQAGLLDRAWRFRNEVAIQTEVVQATYQAAVEHSVGTWSQDIGVDVARDHLWAGDDGSVRGRSGAAVRLEARVAQAGAALSRTVRERAELGIAQKMSEIRTENQGRKVSRGRAAMEFLLHGNIGGAITNLITNDAYRIEDSAGRSMLCTTGEIRAHALAALHGQRVEYRRAGVQGVLDQVRHIPVGGILTMTKEAVSLGRNLFARQVVAVDTSGGHESVRLMSGAHQKRLTEGLIESTAVEQRTDDQAFMYAMLRLDVLRKKADTSEEIVMQQLRDDIIRHFGATWGGEAADKATHAQSIAELAVKQYKQEYGEDNTYKAKVGRRVGAGLMKLPQLAAPFLKFSAFGQFAESWAYAGQAARLGAEATGQALAQEVTLQQKVLEALKWTQEKWYAVGMPLMMGGNSARTRSAQIRAELERRQREGTLRGALAEHEQLRQVAAVISGTALGLAETYATLKSNQILGGVLNDGLAIARLEGETATAKAEVAAGLIGDRIAAAFTGEPTISAQHIQLIQGMSPEPISSQDALALARVAAANAHAQYVDERSNLEKITDALGVTHIADEKMQQVLAAEMQQVSWLGGSVSELREKAENSGQSFNDVVAYAEKYGVMATRTALNSIALGFEPDAAYRAAAAFIVVEHVTGVQLPLERDQTILAGNILLGLDSWQDQDIASIQMYVGFILQEMRDAGITADQLPAALVLYGSWFDGASPLPAGSDLTSAEAMELLADEINQLYPEQVPDVNDSQQGSLDNHHNETILTGEEQGTAAHVEADAVVASEEDLAMAAQPTEQAAIIHDLVNDQGVLRIDFDINHLDSIFPNGAASLTVEQFAGNMLDTQLFADDTTGATAYTDTSGDGVVRSYFEQQLEDLHYDPNNALHRAGLSEFLTQQFRILDTDEDGLISRAEIEGAARDGITTVFAGIGIDADGNNVIDGAEALAFLVDQEQLQERTITISDTIATPDHVAWAFVNGCTASQLEAYGFTDAYDAHAHIYTAVQEAFSESRYVHNGETFTITVSNIAGEIVIDADYSGSQEHASSVANHTDHAETRVQAILTERIAAIASQDYLTAHGVTDASLPVGTMVQAVDAASAEEISVAADVQPAPQEYALRLTGPEGEIHDTLITDSVDATANAQWQIDTGSVFLGRADNHFGNGDGEVSVEEFIDAYMVQLQEAANGEYLNTIEEGESANLRPLIDQLVGVETINGETIGGLGFDPANAAQWQNLEDQLTTALNVACPGGVVSTSTTTIVLDMGTLQDFADAVAGHAVPAEDVAEVATMCMPDVAADADAQVELAAESIATIDAAEEELLIDTNEFAAVERPVVTEIYTLSGIMPSGVQDMRDTVNTFIADIDPAHMYDNDTMALLNYPDSIGTEVTLTAVNFHQGGQYGRPTLEIFARTDEDFVISFTIFQSSGGAWDYDHPSMLYLHLDETEQGEYLHDSYYASDPDQSDTDPYSRVISLHGSTDSDYEYVQAAQIMQSWTRGTPEQQEQTIHDLQSAHWLTLMLEDGEILSDVGLDWNNPEAAPPGWRYDAANRTWSYLDGTAYIDGINGQPDILILPDGTRVWNAGEGQRDAQMEIPVSVLERDYPAIYAEAIQNGDIQEGDAYLRVSNFRHDDSNLHFTSIMTSALEAAVMDRLPDDLREFMEFGRIHYTWSDELRFRMLLVFTDPANIGLTPLELQDKFAAQGIRVYRVEAQDWDQDTHERLRQGDYRPDGISDARDTDLEPIFTEALCWEFTEGNIIQRIYTRLNNLNPLIPPGEPDEPDEPGPEPEDEQEEPPADPGDDQDGGDDPDDDEDP